MSRECYFVFSSFYLRTIGGNVSYITNRRIWFSRLTFLVGITIGVILEVMNVEAIIPQIVAGIIIALTVLFSLFSLLIPQRWNLYQRGDQVVLVGHKSLKEAQKTHQESGAYAGPWEVVDTEIDNGAQGLFGFNHPQFLVLENPFSKQKLTASADWFEKLIPTEAANV